MAWASCNCALRVRRDVALNSLSIGMRGIASEGENEGAGGSCTTDNAIEALRFSGSHGREPKGSGWMDVRARVSG